MELENQVRAVAKYVRMSPQKVRLVCDLVRGKSVDEALAILKLTPKAAAQPVAKTIASAAANADDIYGLARDELYITRIWADSGPMLKRGRFGARGRYKPILKHSAHITVVLAEKT
jgi:large subunit ribosomal protein L22